MKCYFFLFLFILSWSAIQIPAVFACGGGYDYPVTLDQMMEHDILVRGVVVENNAGNSIIQVQRYLMGHGSQYLLVVRQSPSLYIRKAERGYDYGCDGADSALAGEGTLAYFSLDYQSNGTYTLGSHSYLHRIAIIDYADRQVVEYHTYNGDINDESTLSSDNFEAFQVTQQEFEATVAELSGEQSHPPDSYVYPRYRPLYITTENGQSYMMPVDSYELIPLENTPQACVDDCVLVSPDGSHYVHSVPIEDDTYAVWYTEGFESDDWYLGWEVGDATHTPVRITAQELLFSPNGDFLLGWYDNELTIYGFNMWDNYGTYGRLPTISPIWHSQLTGSDFAGQAAWSGNSNAITYLDADGLKWLDVTMMIQARLLVDIDTYRANTANNDNGTSITPILELSATGRYLRYGTAQEWLLIDTFMGLEFDDAIISPDETGFVQISAEEAMTSVLDESLPETATTCMMYNEDNTCIRFSTPSMDACNLPLASCVDEIDLPQGFELQDVQWTSNNSLIFFTCEIGNPDVCYHFERDLDERDRGFSDNLEGYQTNAYEYDSVFGKLAWVVNDYQIRFSTSRFDDPIDFESGLDSPIVSVELGEPLWYLAD